MVSLPNFYCKLVFFLNSLTKISKFTELFFLKVGKILIFIGFTVVSSKNTLLLLIYGGALDTIT